MARTKPKPKPAPADVVKQVVEILQPLIVANVFGKYTKYVQSAIALLMMVLTLLPRESIPAGEPRRAALIRPKSPEERFFDKVQDV